MDNNNQSVLIDVGSGVSIISGLLRISSWKTSTRPKNPRSGTFGFNSQTSSLEYFNGSFWLEAVMKKS
jgi:hypothetical protein